MAEFFGRPHELDVIRAAVARARRERRPTVVVIDGEPGVGKSRLIDEAAGGGPGRVAVAAYEPEMSLPFSLGHDLTRALARSSAAAGQLLDPILTPEPRGPRPDWSSVFEAAHRAAGLSDSLLVTIDDFQWSDERSTALIHYLVRGALADGDALTLIVGGRRSIAVSGFISALERLLGDDLERVTLGPLDHRSTVALARAVNPSLDEKEAASAADRSGGLRSGASSSPGLRTATPMSRASSQTVSRRRAPMRPCFWRRLPCWVGMRRPRISSPSEAGPKIDSPRRGRNRSQLDWPWKMDRRSAWPTIS